MFSKSLLSALSYSRNEILLGLHNNPFKVLSSATRWIVFVNYLTRSDPRYIDDRDFFPLSNSRGIF